MAVEAFEDQFCEGGLEVGGGFFGEVGVDFQGGVGFGELGVEAADLFGFFEELC